jgi:hypothetical protein
MEVCVSLHQERFAEVTVNVPEDTTDEHICAAALLAAETAEWRENPTYVEHMYRDSEIIPSL